MSVREEDRQKNCPSRGLGLAAAAIGVGVGAALYYFFSKSPEQPANEGSTSSNWSSEEPQALSQMSDSYSEDTSSLDISNTTSDEASDEMSPENTISDSSHTSTEESLSNEDLTTDTHSDSLSTLSSNASGQSVSDQSFTSMEMLSDLRSLNLSPVGYTWPLSDDDSTLSRHETLHTPNSHGANTPLRNGSLLNTLQAPSVDSDAEAQEWDVTTSSLGLPEVGHDRTPSPSQLTRLIRGFISEYRLSYMSENNSRERSRTVEDCCICFEPMLRDQHLLELACTHYFHAACIRPWLDEQNTCPNCRKNAIV